MLLTRLLQGAKYFGVETEDRYTCQMFDQHDLGAEWIPESSKV